MKEMIRRATQWLSGFLDAERAQCVAAALAVMFGSAIAFHIVWTTLHHADANVPMIGTGMGGVWGALQQREKRAGSAPSADALPTKETSS